MPALARHARRDIEEPDALDAAGDQPRLLPQLADGQRGGVDVGPLGGGAGRELPAAAADGVAELLDEVQPVAVAGDDQRVGGLVDDPVDALGAVGEADGVLANGHPGVGVDLAAGERLHVHTVPGAGSRGRSAGDTSSPPPRSVPPHRVAGAPRHRPLPGRLRRTAHRAPADGPPAPDGQGGRVGAACTPTTAPTSR